MVFLLNEKRKCHLLLLSNFQNLKYNVHHKTRSTGGFSFAFNFETLTRKSVCLMIRVDIKDLLKRTIPLLYRPPYGDRLYIFIERVFKYIQVNGHSSEFII